VGPAGVAETVWKVLMQWDHLKRWLKSRLTCDGPGGRRVRVGGGSRLEVGDLAIERNFAKFLVSVFMTTSGSGTSPVSGFGVLVR
jgi:uncharacterized protein YndB with AHSA1/START domain